MSIFAPPFLAYGCVVIAELEKMAGDRQGAWNLREIPNVWNVRVSTYLIKVRGLKTMNLLMVFYQECVGLLVLVKDDREILCFQSIDILCKVETVVLQLWLEMFRSLMVELVIALPTNALRCYSSFKR